MHYLSLSIPGPDGGSVDFKPPPSIPQNTALADVISVGFQLALLVGIFACLFMLIWGGFDWMTSQGDKQKLNQARQKLVFAIIGLAIMFMSFFVITLLYGFFRIPLPFDFLKTIR